MAFQDQSVETTKEIYNIKHHLVDLRNKGKLQRAVDLIDQAMTKHSPFGVQNDETLNETVFNDLNRKQVDSLRPLYHSILDLIQIKGEILFDQNRFRESRDNYLHLHRICALLNDHKEYFSYNLLNRMLMVNKRLTQIDHAIES